MTDIEKIQAIKGKIEMIISNLECENRKEIEKYYLEQFKCIVMFEGLLQFIDSLS